jgi:hypothetical protein
MHIIFLVESGIANTLIVTKTAEELNKAEMVFNLSKTIIFIKNIENVLILQSVVDF